MFSEHILTNLDSLCLKFALIVENYPIFIVISGHTVSHTHSLSDPLTSQLWLAPPKSSSPSHCSWLAALRQVRPSLIINVKLRMAWTGH